MGLEADLEDLQDQLAEDLEWYEARIREVAQRAPGWTSVDPGKVVDLFRLESDALPEDGFLGPRMVAIGAEAADEFVEKWFEEGSTPELGHRADEFERDVRELLMFLEGVGAQTGRQADRAHRVLEEWMETNLAHLDELRENDLEALQDLIGEGELDTGLDAREEKAQLWEEQRKRADELRAIWDEFHELVDDGADYTFGGLRDAAALVHRACEGLAGASPALRQETEIDELFESTDLWGEGGSVDQTGGTSRSRGRAANRERSRSVDAPETSDTEQRGTGDASEGTAPTEQLGTRRSEESGPDQWLRQSEPADEGTPDEESSRGEEVETTVLGEDEEDAAETGPISSPPESEREQEVSETEPMLGRGGDETSLDDAHSEELREWRESKLEEVEPSVASDTGDADEPVVEADDSADTLPESPSDEPEPGSETDLPAEDGGDSELAARDEPVEQASSLDREEPDRTEEREPASRDVSPDTEVDSDLSGEVATEATCLRIRTKWQAVEWPPMLAAFGPPVGFLLGMVGLSLARLAGLEAAVNPVVAWSWVEPALGVAVTWMFCTPLLLGWRPRWDGWSFDFVQEVELRDEAKFEIDSEGFSLGRVSFVWSALDSYRLRRWESPDDEMFGWLLIVEPKYYEPLQIIAAESNRSRWEESSEAVVQPPDDAWQVDRAALERFSAALSAREIDAAHSADVFSSGSSTRAASSGGAK